jgi:hypothetical protein
MGLELYLTIAAVVAILYALAFLLIPIQRRRSTDSLLNCERKAIGGNGAAIRDFHGLL